MELPKYEQLKERLRARILQGELRPGDRLPSETELMIGLGHTEIAAIVKGDD